MKIRVVVLIASVLIVIIFCVNVVENSEISCAKVESDHLLGVPLQFNEQMLDQLVHVQSSAVPIEKLLLSASSNAYMSAKKNVSLRDVFCATDAQYWVLKQEVDDGLARIARNRHLTEQSFGLILDLLDIEIMAASYQLAHQTMNIDAEVAELRTEYIRALPSLLKNMYEKIVALANFDVQKNTKSITRTQWEQKTIKFDKQARSTLTHLRGTLEHYYVMIHALQNQADKGTQRRTYATTISNTHTKKAHLRTHSARILKQLSLYRRNLLWI